jgi:hypothetical protein
VPRAAGFAARALRLKSAKRCHVDRIRLNCGEKTLAGQSSRQWHPAKLLEEICGGPTLDYRR